MPGYKDSPQLRGVGVFTTHSQADIVSAAVGQEETQTLVTARSKVAPSPVPSSDHDHALVGLDEGMAHARAQRQGLSYSPWTSKSCSTFL